MKDVILTHLLYGILMSVYFCELISHGYKILTQASVIGETNTLISHMVFDSLKHVL
jgi:uncharacterized membrane protein YagU involved in acid resistance